MSRSLVTKYNAKPFICKTSGVFYKRDHYFGVEVDAHAGGSSRSTASPSSGYIPEMRVRLGLLARGRRRRRAARANPRVRLPLAPLCAEVPAHPREPGQGAGARRRLRRPDGVQDDAHNPAHNVSCARWAGPVHVPDDPSGWRAGEARLSRRCVMGDFFVCQQCRIRHIGTNSKPKNLARRWAPRRARRPPRPRGFRRGTRRSGGARRRRARRRRGRLSAAARARAPAPAPRQRDGAAAAGARPRRHRKGGGVAAVVAAHAHHALFRRRPPLERALRHGASLRRAAPAEQQRAHIRCSAEEGSSTPSRAATARTSRISTRAARLLHAMRAERQRYVGATAPVWVGVGCGLCRPAEFFPPSRRPDFSVLATEVSEVDRLSRCALPHPAA